MLRGKQKAEYYALEDGRNINLSFLHLSTLNSSCYRGSFDGITLKYQFISKQIELL